MAPIASESQPAKIAVAPKILCTLVSRLPLAPGLRTGTIGHVLRRHALVGSIVRSRSLGRVRRRLSASLKQALGHLESSLAGLAEEMTCAVVPPTAPMVLSVDIRDCDPINDEL
jgi:hypothetical protein